MKLAITIPGRPVGKGRPRVVSRGGHVRAYTPERTRVFEGIVAQLAHAAIRDCSHIWPRGADYAISVNAYVSHTKGGSIRIGDCPDLDNVIKAVCDGLEGIAYENDRQVVGIVDSWTHHVAEDERTEVVLEVLG